MTDWIEPHIGHHEVLRTLPAAPMWARTPHRVVEVVDSEGRRWFMKRVAARRLWGAEVGAYRDWLPALGDRVPQLRAADRESLSLLLSVVPGHRPRPRPLVSRQAGQLLRRLHESRPPRLVSERDRAEYGRVLDTILRRHPGLLSRAEEAFVRSEVALLGSLAVGDAVPCHGDYHPRNWLRDEDDVVRIIDFGAARWRPAAYDLGRLAHTVWWDRPDLMRPFLEGYGREPGADEARYLRALLALTTVSEMGRARGQRNAEREASGRVRLAALVGGDVPWWGVPDVEAPAPREVGSRVRGLIRRLA